MHATVTILFLACVFLPLCVFCLFLAEEKYEPQRELRKRSKPVSKYIHLLAYADDLVLLSSSCANVQRMLHILQENALKVGFKLNFGKNKTEYIALGRTKPEGVADLSGIQLTKTTLYRYLGCFPMDATADMDARIKKTWAALKSLEGVWQSSCSIDIKRKLFFSLCEPILGYGLLAFPQTIRQTQALHATVNRMLRLRPQVENHFPSFVIGWDLPCPPFEELYLMLVF